MMSKTMVYTTLSHRCLPKRTIKFQPLAQMSRRISKKINDRLNMLSFSSRVLDLKENSSNMTTIGKEVDLRRQILEESRYKILSMA